MHALKEQDEVGKAARVSGASEEGVIAPGWVSRATGREDACGWPGHG